MRNYFEDEYGYIIPFEKVVEIQIRENNKLFVFTGKYFNPNVENGNSEFPIEQLQDYKDWLALKQQALEDSVKPMYVMSPLPNDIGLYKRITTVSSDFSKPEITKEMLLDIIKAYLDICDACEYYDLNKQYAYPCCECGIQVSKFNPRRNILKKLNEKWQDEKNSIRR